MDDKRPSVSAPAGRPLTATGEIRITPPIRREGPAAPQPVFLPSAQRRRLAGPRPASRILPTAGTPVAHADDRLRRVWLDREPLLARERPAMVALDPQSHTDSCRARMTLTQPCGLRFGLALLCNPWRDVFQSAASLNDHVDRVVVGPHPDHVAVWVDDSSGRPRL